MTEAVRLVVWDLDETFWKGTVTEGGIREYVQAHHDIVIELAKRGINVMRHNRTLSSRKQNALARSREATNSSKAICSSSFAKTDDHPAMTRPRTGLKYSISNRVRWLTCLTLLGAKPERAV